MNRVIIFFILICLPINLKATSVYQANCGQEQAVQSPRWVSESVIYSLFVRNFSSSGDFAGATGKLDELSQLGVDVIWLLPIHPIGKERRKGSLGSPYSIQDYYAIDPALGTKADFKQFVIKAHQLGLKVIMDIVVNHTAWDSVLMQTPEFYLKDENGRIIPPVADWYDVAALDYGNPQLRTYIIDMMKYWLKEFDLDGFRLDAVGLMPLDFWEEARKQLHDINSNIVLLGEIEDPKSLIKAFDVNYSWQFEEVLQNVIVNGVPATESLKCILMNEKENNPKGALLLHFSDNHDKKRAIARFGEKGALAASALIFALNGIPLLYNGMEVGDVTESCSPALFEKMPLFWGSEKFRSEFRPFYYKLITLRKQHAVLRNGALIWIQNSEESRVVTFLKKTDTETFLITINFSNQPFKGAIDIDSNTTIEKIFPDKETALSNPKNFTLGPWEYCLYHCH